MSELPTGTVTFLFTDIEGSTRLLEEHGDRYADVLRRHRVAVEDAVGEHRGVVVDTQGDAFFLAFARAADAVAAAGQAQETLEVPVRMGLHTGEPTLTGHGYVGIDVHRAARICSAAHGRQVVLSETTRRALAGESNSLLLADLGEHRLKDLGRPIRLYQLGDEEFPPLRTLYRANLPVQPTPFLGRERELADVRSYLAREDVRLLTLTGPGGSGKTRLALQAAAEFIEDYPDGAWWVSLQSIRDPELVLPAVSQTLGAEGDLAAHVADKRLLLLLDNMEQVAGASEALAGLLSSCPNLRVLATSREPLGITAEQAYHLEPFADEEAVAFFVARARTVDPQFSANGEVAEICRRLDNLPLALELAAARVRLLSPKELLAKLERRLPALTVARRDVPERQRTLRAAIEWSHDLLDADEQTLFRRLSVFGGSFTLEVAEEVCDADLETLESLAAKSLLHREDGGMRMLETVREYAAERLEEGGEAGAFRRRQAEEISRRYEHTDRSRYEFHEDADNWRSGIEWAVERGDPELAITLARAGPTWRMPPSEAVAWADRALEAHGDRCPAVPLGHFLVTISYQRLAVGDAHGGVGSAERAVTLFRDEGDTEMEAIALSVLAEQLRGIGDLVLARARARESIDLHERLGSANQAESARELSGALHALGEIELELGDREEARSLLERAVAVQRAGKGPNPHTLHGLGDAALEAGDLDGAGRAYGEALRISHETQLFFPLAHCLAGLAAVEAERGNTEACARLWAAAVGVLEEYGIHLEGPDRYEARLGRLGPGFERLVEQERLQSVEDLIGRALAAGVEVG